MEHNYILPLFLGGTVLISIFAFTLIAFLVLHNRKQIKLRLKQQQSEFDHQQQLLQTKLLVQEQSMNLISREIHDNLSQSLGLAVVKLHMAQRQTDQQKLSDGIKSAIELAEQTIHDMRYISHSLNSEYIKKIGLTHAVEKELARINGHYPIQCELQVDGVPRELPTGNELNIVRIVQEALKNTLQHASANKVLIRFNYGADDLSVTVTDDGVGFDTGKNDNNSGIGLINIRERIKILSGDISIDSAPGKGSRIHLTIPISAYAAGT
jgi:signal transduction histidine kinase